MRGLKLVLSLAIGLVLLLPSLNLQAQTQQEIEQEIKLRQQRIELLKQQAAQYEASLKAKRQQSLTLSNQISILNDKISQAQLEIEAMQDTIETTSLQIRQLEQAINSRQKELAMRKVELAGLVRWYARTQNQSALKIVFTQPSFAAFTGQMKSLKTIQLSMSDLIDSIEDIKKSLEDNRASLESHRQELVKSVDDLQLRRESLEGQQETKGYLLAETKSSEARFSSLLTAAKREQESTSSEITSLERQARELLKDRGLEITDSSDFIWPVSRARGITAIFHDPDYPFRKVFEHTGIDIRAAQGTPIRAAASGYVAQARTGGARGYGYVMIVHSNGLATVYGHVSKIFVKQDSFVSQGQIVANSGGLPGTPGAGPFSTGAHLHFEVRKNGIPVNPMNYLP
jgi:murein DD-endopeptidase MepM/ murein hydrolase activator NlpD